MNKAKMRHLLFVVMVVALIVSVGGLSVWAQDSDEALQKKYAPILGDYEFDMEGQFMLVSFWVESGALWGGPEGQEAAELSPVEGKELEFEINTPDGQYMEVEFIKDEAGKIVKCAVLAMGMEMEGIKIKK